MIVFVLGASIAALLFQAGIDGPRKAFVDCLRQAGEQAQSQSVASDAYRDFAVAACSAKAGALKTGLVNFDVKNGIKKAQASTDADAQIDDYYLMSLEKYESRNGKPKN